MVLPLWAFAASVVWLAVGAFMMQVMVQGAWGVIPVHLNELSPDEARGTFPGFVYQLGNLIASVNATLAGRHRRSLWWRLWLRACAGRRHGRSRDRHPRRARHEAKGVVFGAGGTGPEANSPPQGRPYDIKVTTPVTG